MSGYFKDILEPNLPVRADALNVSEPINPRLEYQLIMHDIVGEPPRNFHEWRVWSNCVSLTQRFLFNYFAEHQELPVGKHYVGVPASYKFGSDWVDFDAVREQARKNAIRRDSHNLKNWVENPPDTLFQIYREISVGLKEQDAGRDPNELIYRMRKRLEYRTLFDNSDSSRDWIAPTELVNDFLRRIYIREKP